MNITTATRRGLARPVGRSLLAVATVGTVLALSACSSATDSGSPGSGTASAAQGVTDTFPVTLQHVYGSTTIEKAPQRVATTGWVSEDAVLALGVVPVGFPTSNYGDEDGDGLLPWVKDKLTELGATGDSAPALYDETDGIDTEAIANTEPDLILGVQSGLTQDAYNTLSKIAPTVPFSSIAWGEKWRDQTTTIAKALGRSQQGADLVSQTEQKIADAVAAHSELKGKTAAFVYVDPTNLSKISIYNTNDSRPAYLQDLGLAPSDSIAKLSEGSQLFYQDISAENVDVLSDVDVLVTYGDDSTLATLQKDPLLSKIPAVANGAVAVIPPNTGLASAASPSVLSIAATVDDYATLLAKAAAQAK